MTAKRAMTDKELCELIASLGSDVFRLDVSWVDEVRIPSAAEIRGLVDRMTPEERRVALLDVQRASEGLD